MTERPRVLAIGGIDPTGGAGLATDVRMIQARGGLAVAVPACLTVQGRTGLEALEVVSPDLFAAMVGAAIDSGLPSAIKTGLLGDAGVVERVASVLQAPCAAGVPLVVDPVLSVSAGGFAATEAVVEAYLRHLVPLACVVTPNLPEASRLAPEGPESLLSRGCGAVLVTGGHASGDVVEDRLLTSDGEVVLRHPRLAVGVVRGTGCALASALAFGLGHGLEIEDASREAVSALARCLEQTPRSDDDDPAMLVIS